MPMIDQFAQMKIDERAAQLEAVAQKESLGLAIKHDSVATIRKVGDDLMFTPDQLAFVVGEIKKCRKDIVYFAEKYFRIIGDGGLQLIKLYPKQKELLRTMQRESRVVCLASRQVGKSTTYTIYFLWLSMFFPDRKIAIAAHQFATAEEILARIKLAYEYIPKEIKPAVVAYNNKQIHFDNNSEVRAFATGGNSLAGFSFDCIALDEAALWPAAVAETFFTTTMPILSSRKNSKAIMVSTPRGTVNNKFYDIWTEANSENADNNKDGWVPFRIDWWDVPGRDDAWRQQQIATMGAQRFTQEFGNEFTSSGEALLVPDDIIHKFRRELNDAPASALVNLSSNDEKPVNAEIWAAYEPGHCYAAGGDVSEGTGNDSSVLYIMDVTDTRKGIPIVAKLASASLSVLDFANACSKLLKAYNWPIMIVENNGVGSGFVEALLYTYNVPADRVFSEVKATTGEIRYGIHSNNANKLEAALFCRELLTTEEIPMRVADKHLIDEMAVFIRKMNQNSITYKASGKAHDDHMMAFIWGLYLLYYRNIEKYYVVKEAFKAKRGQVLPGLLENVHEVENPEVLVESTFHKMIVAALTNDPSILDGALDDDKMKAQEGQQAAPDTPLYYGAAGRGRSFGGKKNFVTVSESYSQLDFDRDPEKSWEDADDEDDWERPDRDGNVFVGI